MSTKRTFKCLPTANVYIVHLTVKPINTQLLLKQLGFLTVQLIIYIFAGTRYDEGRFSCILLLSLNSISLNNSFKSSNDYMPSHTTMN